MESFLNLHKYSHCICSYRIRTVSVNLLITFKFCIPFQVIEEDPEVLEEEPPAVEEDAPVEEAPVEEVSNLLLCVAS